MRKLIEQAEKIPGWMHRTELEQLATWSLGLTSVLEVGCFAGRSTKVFANCAEHVTVIDNWEGIPADHPLYGKKLQAAFKKNLKKEIEAGRVHMHESLHDLPPSFFTDLIFIDGAHDYESVKRDCETAIQYRAHEGTTVCGHDWLMPDVQKAVLEVFPNAHQAAGTLWIAE